MQAVRRPSGWLRWALACSLGLAVPVAGATAATWKGSATTRDGVLHVTNPAAPMESALELQPEQLWEIGGESDAEGEFFGVISHIVFDKTGNLYLLDRQLNEVKVFTRDGAYVRTIGREGEGPGEFRRPGTMFFLPNGELAVVQSFPGKLVALTPDGAPGSDFPLQSAEEGGFRALMDARFRGGSLVFLGGNFKMGEGKVTRSTALAHVGLDGQEVARFFEESTTNNVGNMIIREKEGFRIPWDVLPDGRIIASRTFDYEFSIWNPDGSVDRMVTREYKSLQRNKEEMAEAEKRLAGGIVIRGRGGRVKPTIEVENRERDIEDLVVTEGGHIWVLSSRGSKKAPEGVCAVYDVYDAEGHFLQEVSLKIDADLEEDRLIFSGDRLFVIKEYAAAARAEHGGEDEEASEEAADEEEPQPISVVCYRFEWQPQAVASPAK
jgi:hypothetical protein